ncbi:MAG TPA: alpha/beta hydrolase [Myxococcales bacterium]|nr:alpha/beta hydrolase [Myxococcales bacterium]
MAYRKVTRFVAAADGTRISYHTHLDPGSGDEAVLGGRRALLLTNGIGTSENFWRHLVEALAGDHRVVHWDYRGHGSSDVAATGDYSLRAQADDLVRVTEAVVNGGGSGEPPVQVAFSMGVPVLLEMYRRRPELAPAMVLIAGAPDAPWDREGLFRVRGFGAAFRRSLRAARPLLPALAPLWRAALDVRIIYPAGRLTGQLRSRAGREDVEEFMTALRRMDLGAYWATLIALFDARASDVLAAVKVPVLILGAEHDTLYPARQVERMRDALPHARWHLVRDAGHGTLIEAGPEIAALVRSFLGETPA